MIKWNKWAIADLAPKMGDFAIFKVHVVTPPLHKQEFGVTFDTIILFTILYRQSEILYFILKEILTNFSWRAEDMLPQVWILCEIS